MYKQYKTVLAGIVFLCAPTAALAEFTLTDAAIVLVPAALGALAGRETARYSLEQEREELDQARRKSVGELSNLISSKALLKGSKETLESIRDSKKRGLREINHINQSMYDTNQQIDQLNDYLKQAYLAVEKNNCLRKIAALEKDQNPLSAALIQRINQESNAYLQAIKMHEEALRSMQYNKGVFERAKNPDQMTLEDKQYINQNIQFFDQQLQEFDKELSKKQREFKSIKEDLNALTSEESRRLRDGALIGGAIGGALGVGTLVVAKYDLLERIKPPKISQRERLQIRQAVAMQNARNAELQALMDAQVDGAYKSLSDADKAAYCFLNGIDLEAIHDEESRRILQRSMGEWLLNGRPEVELALLGMFAQRVKGDLPLDGLDRVDEISSAFDEVD